MKTKNKYRYFFIAYCIIDEGSMGDKIIYGNSSTRIEGGGYVQITPIEASFVSAYISAGRSFSSSVYARITNIVEISKSDYEDTLIK